MSSVNNVNNFDSSFPQYVNAGEKKRKRDEKDWGSNKKRKIGNNDPSKPIKGYSPFDTDQNMTTLVFFHILSFLPAKDLHNFSLTKKSFKSIVSLSNENLLNCLDLGTLIPWVRIIDRNVLEKYVDIEAWGLSYDKQAPLNKTFFEKLKIELKKFSSLPIEGNAGITVEKLPSITPREDFTLNKFIEIGKSLEQPDVIKLFEDISVDFINTFGNVPIDTNSTILLTNNVLQESRGLTFEAQKQKVEGYGYEMPDILHVLTSTVFTYLMDGSRLYPREPDLTYTRCSNAIKVNGRNSPSVIGGFGTGGLIISDYEFEVDYVGVAAQRKF